MEIKCKIYLNKYLSKWSKITFIFLTGITINWPGINQKLIISFNGNYQQLNSNYQQFFFRM